MSGLRKSCQSRDYTSAQSLSVLNATRLRTRNEIETRKFQFQHRGQLALRENAELANGASGTVSIYLQHPFRQASFLGKLLEILRVGIVIDRKVALHRP